MDWITSLLFVVARCLVRDMIKYRWRRRRSGWSGSSPVHVHLLDFCTCASGHNNGVHGIQSVSWHVTIWSHSARLGRFVPSTATDATEGRRVSATASERNCRNGINIIIVPVDGMVWNRYLRVVWSRDVLMWIERIYRRKSSLEDRVKCKAHQECTGDMTIEWNGWLGHLSTTWLGGYVPGTVFKF